MAELVDAKVSKTFGFYARVGSIPTSATKPNKLLIKKIMKRILSFLIIAIMAISLTSCDWFKKSEQTKEQPTVETYIESDMEYMAENYGEVYVWYETEVIYNDFLDEENDGSIESIKSVFQHEKVVDSGAYVKVVTITHNGDLMDVEAVDGWYAECYNMRGKELPVTFKDAYDAIMAVNLPKPHTRCCVLRDQVGPVASNPQYIYGVGLLFVDAVNGNVSEVNPVFPNENEDTIEEEIISNDSLPTNNDSLPTNSNDSLQ